MNKQKPQLGKGIGALLGTDVQKMLSENSIQTPSIKSSENTNPMMVDITQLVINKDQPRKLFKEKDLIELADSIKENGILQPILVSELDGKFSIIAGERRYRAAKMAGLSRVPVLLKRATKKDTLVMAIIENVQRSDLNCVEEALAYYQLMNEFQLTQEEVAKKVGKDRSTIANFLRILKLPKEVIVSLQKELITFGHAKVLAVLTNDEEVKRICNEVIAKQLSVRELEILVKASGKKKPVKNETKFIDEKYQGLKNKLEQKTGYHFAVKAKKNGSGTITIRFSNEAEFDSIYGYLLK